MRCVVTSPREEEGSSWVGMRSLKQLRKEQLNDIDIRPVLTWLENFEEPSPNEVYTVYNQGIVTKHLWGNGDRLKIHEGVLYYEWMEAPVGAYS